MANTAMTQRQRLLAALRREPVDQVPVSPDVAMMLPARYAGRPYWDVFVNEQPPLWQAQIDLARRFDFALLQETDTVEGDAPGVTTESRIIEQTDDAWRVCHTTHTPHGDLTLIKRYPAAQSPWTEKPIITEPEREMDALLSTLPDPSTLRVHHNYPSLRKMLGDSGIVSTRISVPLAWWLYQRVDLERAILDFYDGTELLERALHIYGEWALAAMEAQFRLQPPDLIMFGGSVSSMSVVSPALYRRYAYPWLVRACALADRYHVPTGVHMCGKSAAALDMLVDAGVTMVEPLERPPGGDVTLAEVRKRYGARLVLKGNVNTFETLMRGTPQDVRGEARQCISDAGAIGFILASGDQVPGNTPEENFAALVTAATQP